MDRSPTVEHFKRVAARGQRHMLPNGLTVLLWPDHSVPVVTSMLWYRVGSRFEESGATGVSHFLEHLMFKGSQRYAKGEIDYITTRNGGSNNAFTSGDYTSYYFSFASDRWWPALEIESDRMRNLLFDSAEVELERQVILEELRMERDDPWYALRQQIEQTVLSDHPYRFPIIGYQPDVEALSLDALRAHYQRYYTPANAVLVAAGDIDTRVTLQRIEELFGPIPSVIEACHAPRPSTIRNASQRIEVSRRGRVDRLLMAFPCPSLSQAEHYAFHLLDRILVDGRLSRLYNRLVERTPLAAFVSGDFADTAEPYLYFLRLELLPGSRSELVEQILLEELASLLDEGVTDAELERAKNQCLFGTVASFETTFDLAAQIGLTEVLGRPDYWRTYLDRVEAVQASDVQQIASHYLALDRVTIGVSPRAQ